MDELKYDSSGVRTQEEIRRDEGLELFNSTTDYLAPPQPDTQDNEQQAQPEQPNQPPQQQQSTEPQQPAKPEEQKDQQYPWQEGYDIGDFGRNTGEALVAPIVGTLDAAIGIPNELLFKHMGFQIPEIPKFQNDAAQLFREVSSVLVPTLAGGVGGGVRIASLASKAGKASKASRLAKVLAGEKMQIFGRGMFATGVGAVVDYSVPTSGTDANLTGTLKKSWPATWGWIPDNIATLDGDSEDVYRMKNAGEGAFLGLFGTALDMFMSIGTSVKRSTMWVPEVENAKVKADSLNNKVDLDAEDILIRDAEKIDADLQELAVYEFEKSVELGTTEGKAIRGLHDTFHPYEMGIRTADDGGIVQGSVSLLRITNNDGSINGRLGSFFSGAAMQYGLDNPQGAMDVIVPMSKQLKKASQIGFKSGTQYYSYKDIDEAGTKFFQQIMEMDTETMKRTLFDPSNSTFMGESAPYYKLTDVGNNAVFKAVNAYLNKYADKDLAKASAYTSGSLSGQLSDLAQGARLMDGNVSVEQTSKQILDRIQFLSTLNAQNRFATARTLNLMNMWRRKKFTLSEGDLIKDTASNLQRIAQEQKDFRNILQAVNDERPEMLKPLMLAYEVTNGEVNSITKLNNYVQQSTGLIQKAFFDAQPEIPSAVVQGIWANIYNSVLSSVVTPLKAGLGNAALLIERPVATFMGSAIAGDRKTMRRALYQYQAVGDTFTKAWSHMTEIFARVSKDPTGVGYVMRDDIARQNEKQIDALNAFAKAAEERGEFGPSALMGQVEALHDLERNPILRFGPNAMTAFDGFTRSVIGNIEARGAAFDTVNASLGKLDNKAMKEIADKHYEAMFKDGVITDKAVEYASREISMNLDSPATKSINALLQAAPLFKPFMMFPRTSINMLNFAGSHNPAGLFFNQLNEFSKPFEKVGYETAEKLLLKRGIPVKADTIEQAYNTMRAELKGRKAIGTLAVSGTAFAFMNDRIRGDGHFDKEKQRVRRDAGWQPRTYKGWDGKWYTYENLGPVGDWMALTANIADNLVDGTLDANDGQILFAKAGYILSSSITNKSFLAGLEPMNDILAGNPAAMARWGSTFSSGFIPLSGLRNDFSRILTPQRKELDMDMGQLIANRNPFLKDTIPDTYDYIDGGLVGMPGAWTRVWNGVSPWKVHDDISEEKQFLVDVEFDGRPVLSTDGSGVKLTPEQRSDVQRIMGETQIFKKKIQEIMRSEDGKEFRKEFVAARNANRDVDYKKFKQVHMKLDRALNRSIQYAIGRSSFRDEIKEKEFNMRQTIRATERNNLEDLRSFNNY